MAEVEPGMAHFLCPYEGCGLVIDVEVPLRAEILSTGAAIFHVEREKIDVQPLWDHTLVAHGPNLEDVPHD